MNSLQSQLTRFVKNLIWTIMGMFTYPQVACVNVPNGVYYSIDDEDENGAVETEEEEDCESCTDEGCEDCN